jgi:hypothetical protein
MCPRVAPFDLILPGNATYPKKYAYWVALRPEEALIFDGAYIFDVSNYNLYGASFVGASMSPAQFGSSAVCFEFIKFANGTHVAPRVCASRNCTVNGSPAPPTGVTIYIQIVVEPTAPLNISVRSDWVAAGTGAADPGGCAARFDGFSVVVNGHVITENTTITVDLGSSVSTIVVDSFLLLVDTVSTGAPIDYGAHAEAVMVTVTARLYNTISFVLYQGTYANLFFNSTSLFPARVNIPQLPLLQYQAVVQIELSGAVVGTRSFQLTFANPNGSSGSGNGPTTTTGSQSGGAQWPRPGVGITVALSWLAVVVSGFLF